MIIFHQNKMCTIIEAEIDCKLNKYTNLYTNFVRSNFHLTTPSVKWLRWGEISIQFKNGANVWNIIRIRFKYQRTSRYLRGSIATYVCMSKSFYKIVLKFSEHTTPFDGDALSQCVHFKHFIENNWNWKLAIAKCIHARGRIGKCNRKEFQ